MPFVLKKSPTYTWPVTTHVPADDGKKLIQQFEATFAVMPLDKVAILTGAAGTDIDGALLNEILVGWSDVKDDEGNDVPFTPETRDQALALPYVRTALFAAYQDSISGAKRKN